MQEVLLNMANIELLRYCERQGIDPSGSHVAKNGRGFTYSLVNETDGRAFVSVTFTKNTVPQFSWHNAARDRGAK